MTHSSSEIVFEPLPSDDPTRRRPNIEKAKSILHYEPRVGLDDGLSLTVNWFKQQLGL